MKPISTDSEAELSRLHVLAFGWAMSCCQWNRAEAEDVLQASYLKVLEGRAKYAGRSSYKTWLFGVIRHTAAEQRRREHVARFGPLAWLDGRAEERQAGPAADAALVRSEDSARLRGALEGLSERQRAVLHLVFYQDLTVEEASEVLSISVGTARTHYERAKERLRHVLAESEHE